MSKINKSIIKFNNIKPLNNNNNIQNNSYDNILLNIYSLGVKYNSYNSTHNSYGEKNYNMNNSFYFNKQEKMIESEYIKIKKKEKEKPEEIKKNIYFFENNILLPI
jgi:hypothetical protein